MTSSEYKNKKKLGIDNIYFNIFLTLLVGLVIIQSLGYYVDSLFRKEQLDYQIELLNIDRMGKDFQNIVLSLDSSLSTKFLSKFLSISLFTIGFCISIWMGRKRFQYGYLYLTLWLMCFGLFIGATFILSLKPFWTDYISMVLNSLVVVFLILWGYRLYIYRIKLKNEVKNHKKFDF